MLKGLALTLLVCALALAVMRPSGDPGARSLPPVAATGNDPRARSSPDLESRRALPARHRPGSREVPSKHEERPAAPTEATAPRLRDLDPDDRARLGPLLAAAEATPGDASDDREVMREFHRLALERHEAALERQALEESQTEQP